MNTTNALTIGISLIDTIIHKLPKIGAIQRRFIPHILLHCLSIRGRFNFMQMSREGIYHEQTYRNQFEKEFDFIAFNQQLVEANCSDDLVIAFDPSYISKSGKHTPQLGYFYSGCAGQHKKGLEIGGFAAVDLQWNTAFHLIAESSPRAIRDRVDLNTTLLDHYVDLIDKHAPTFLTISTIIVADAYFAKCKYVDAVTENNMTLVSRLRNDADLKYLYKGPKTNKKGRPRKYAGKVDLKNIDRKIFQLNNTTDQYRMSSAVVHSVAFNRSIKVVYLELLDKNGKVKGYKILFSTDLEMEAHRVLKIYKGRFQIEFLYRDAKQYAGLEHCQARSEAKLHFQFNTSLTSIGIGKLIHQKQYNNSKNRPISIHDIAAELSNINFAERLFSKYGINLYFYKNRKTVQFIRNFGKRAA